MKIVAVYGSPRKNGNSSTLLREVIRGARDAGHEVLEFDLNDMELKGCQGCGVCKEKTCYCVVPDGLAAYWPVMHEAGALLVSAPNYCSLPAGPVLTFMNRHYCESLDPGPNHWEFGKKLVTVFSQGWENADGYRDKYQHFIGEFTMRGMELQGCIIHAGHTPAKDCPDLLARAYEAGRAL